MTILCYDFLLTIATSGATFAGSVMVNGATQQTNTELNVNGAMQQDGKTSWSDSSGLPLTTTGRVVAGLVGNSGGNGASALYMFTCYGGNGYQRIVYSIKNSGGTWIVEKDITLGVENGQISIFGCDSRHRTTNGCVFVCHTCYDCTKAAKDF